uniref:Uncharacterized protein n=1 Tax=Cucumis melo TaxID=3656 RepID=A0A9I9EGH3_CUCME
MVNVHHCNFQFSLRHQSFLVAIETSPCGFSLPNLKIGYMIIHIDVQKKIALKSPPCDMLYEDNLKALDALFWINTMDAARSVVSRNDVILNRSCRDMGVEASYVRAAQHRWPNKPPILEVNLVVVLVRDFQAEKKHWIKEKVQNYKRSLHFISHIPNFYYAFRNQIATPSKSIWSASVMTSTSTDGPVGVDALNHGQNGNFWPSYTYE